MSEGDGRMTRIVAQLMVAMLVPVGVAAAQGPKIVLTPTSAQFQAEARSGLTAPQTVRITNGGSGIVAGLSQSIVYTAGQPSGWLTATLSGPSAPATLTLRANASATLQAGTYTATVAIKALNPKGGSPNFVVTFVVRTATTTTQLTSSPNPSLPGQSVAFTATVSSPSGTPSGTVQLVGSNGSALATGTLDAQGVVRFTIATLTDEGAIPFGACYAGNGFFGSSCASLLTQHVEKYVTTVDLTSAPNPATTDQAVTFSATVSGPPGTGTPTGTVEFVVSTTLLGTAELDAQGVARLTTSILTEGNTIVGACYRGDFQFAQGCAPLVTQRVVSPVGVIAGILRDRGGTPIAGATVRLDLGVHHIIVTTASDGTYALTGIEPGTYTVQALTSFSACEDFNGSVTVAAGDHLTQNITLNCPPVAQGLVVVSGGLAPVGMAIALTPVRGGTTITAQIHPQGDYSVAVAPGEYSLTVVGLGTLCHSSGAVASFSHQREQVTTNFNVTCSPAFTLSPATYDFGPVNVGPAGQVFTLTNQSESARYVGLVSLSSDYVDVHVNLSLNTTRFFDYSLDLGDCINDRQLAPNESCAMTVVFRPQANGVRHAGLNVGDASTEITGTGDPGLQLSVSPNPYDFGTVNLGAKRTVLVTLTNHGPVAAAALPNITLGGSNASEFTRIPEVGDCGDAGMEVGGSCTLRFAFTPTSTGPKSGLITATFQSAVPGWAPGSARATLTGTGSLEAMIFLSSSKNPSVAEEDVTFTAQVTHSDGSSLSPMPVGLPITFVLSGQANRIVPLGSDGTASLKTSFKTAGAYPISVSFADDVLGTGSNSLTQLVTPLPGDPTVGRVAGTIHDRDGQPVVGVTVFLIGATVPTPKTAADGSYEMNGIPPGKYTILATKGRFCVDLNSSEFTVTAQQTTTVSLTMNCPPLLSGAVTVTGPAPGALSVQATPVRGGPSFSGPVQSDGTYSLFIGADEYNVAAVGPLRCRSSVEGIDAVHQQDLVTADLTVSCTNEIVRITPTSYDFGGVRWGQSSSPATFTVTNVTEQPLLFGHFGYGIGVISPSVLNCNGLNCNFNDQTYEFVTTGGNCSADMSLAAGASCSFDVRFTPLLSGVQNGTVEVCTSCTTVGLHQTVVQATLAAHARDAEATLALSPGSFDFGAVPVNTSSKTKQLVAVNTGPDASGPISVSLTGADAADFALAGKCEGATLAGSSGESCQVDVTFTPHGFGPRTATVTITGTPGGTSSATLTGTGDGRLTIGPTAQDFGTVPIYNTSVVREFTVTNSSQASVVIQSVGVSGPKSIGFNLPDADGPGCLGANLGPQESCTVGIDFGPSVIGPRSGTLTVTDFAGHQASAALVAEGTDQPVLQVRPLLWDFGTVEVGQSSARVAFTVTNTAGAHSILLETFSVTGPGAADYVLDRGSCNLASLDPGANCTIYVTFKPPTSGQRSATITVAGGYDPSGSWTGSATVNGTGFIHSPVEHHAGRIRFRKRGPGDDEQSRDVHHPEKRRRREHHACRSHTVGPRCR